MPQLNETHDATRRSWVESANLRGAEFPIQTAPAAMREHQAMRHVEPLDLAGAGPAGSPRQLAIDPNFVVVVDIDAQHRHRAGGVEAQGICRDPQLCAVPENDTTSETRFPQQVTGYAAGIAQKRLGYDGYGSALIKRFDASRP
jgi:hypothetical protein